MHVFILSVIYWFSVYCFKTSLQRSGVICEHTSGTYYNTILSLWTRRLTPISRCHTGLHEMHMTTRDKLCQPEVLSQQCIYCDGRNDIHEHCVLLFRPSDGRNSSDVQCLKLACNRTLSRAVFITDFRGGYLYGNLGHTILFVWQQLVASLSHLGMSSYAGISLAHPHAGEEVFRKHFAGLYTGIGFSNFTSLAADLDEIKSDVIIGPSISGGPYYFWTGGDTLTREHTRNGEFIIAVKNVIQHHMLHQIVPPTPFEAVYIVRQGRRCVLNDEAVTQAIRSSGFNLNTVRFETLDLHTVLHIMRQATLLIGPHGAGLNNAMFMHPQSVVIELMPYRQASSSFFNLAAISGLTYLVTGPSSIDDVLVCGPKAVGIVEVAEGTFFDAPFRIPINELNATLMVARRILQTSSFLYTSPCRIGEWLLHGYNNYAQAFPHYSCHNTTFQVTNK